MRKFHILTKEVNIQLSRLYVSAASSSEHISTSTTEYTTLLLQKELLEAMLVLLLIFGQRFRHSNGST